MCLFLFPNTLMSNWPVLWTHLSKHHRWAHGDHNRRLVLPRHHSELLPQNRPGWVRSHTVSTTAGEMASLWQHVIWTDYDTLVLLNHISCWQIALALQEWAAFNHFCQPCFSILFIVHRDILKGTGHSNPTVLFLKASSSIIYKEDCLKPLLLCSAEGLWTPHKTNNTCEDQTFLHL